MHGDARMSGHIDEVAEILSGLVDHVDATGFVRAYLGQEAGVDPSVPAPARAARMLAAHLALGRRRTPGADLVGLLTPHAGVDGWDAGGSTLVQIVTDDRPFLVETLTTILSDEGWSIRDLSHPILDVRRGTDGVLTGAAAHVVGDPDEESWISVEAFPPLGASAAEQGPRLEKRVRDALATTRRAHDDSDAMLDRLRQVRDRIEQTAQPVSAHEVGQVTALLDWLADDHFDLLGHRQYTVEGRTYTAVPGTGLGLLAADEEPEFHAYLLDESRPELVVVTKDSRRSPIGRGGFLDYVGVRLFDRSGAVVGEHRFLGLLTDRAHTEPVARIPLLAEKAREVTRRIGLDPDSHSGQALALTMDTFPREELFQASTDELVTLLSGLVEAGDRRRTRLFLRRGRYGRFWSCLVYLPRDRYRTASRERIQALLMERLGGSSLQFRASVGEAPLARLFIVIKRPDGAPDPVVDLAALEREVADAARTWADAFNDEAAGLASEERGVEFGEGYEAAHTARQAVADLRLANELAGPDDLRFALYHPDSPDDPADLRFKVITRTPMTLSQVMPHLNALGIDVIDERPFQWTLRTEPVWVYDFGFLVPVGQTLEEHWTREDRARFADAFRASWTGAAHPGALNRLVMRAGLTWAQVGWLRGIARYLRQAGIPYSQQYVAAALNAQPRLARGLVDAFEARFDPAGPGDAQARRERFEERVAALREDLDAVDSLDQDRIFRMFVDVLCAIVRTNAFAADQPALAYKLVPSDLDLLPQPRPAHEIFVYSPRVEGVHLRFGDVARGGLRWSDRLEDFRTEVLGLVKAQMVKNTVIVPVGAKGGFVPQCLPDPREDRAGWLAEGQACYRIFISSLLSVTDNLVGGQVVGPPQVVRHDGDDTYLVVAADKGTATFSDIANGIAAERGFWLGDAFASGGSVGYDHKGMGITARGAWESVRRHFYELGLDCQTEDFTCVGIGDMSGDVFGNGMLLSRHTRLVAAFNHLHVFLDPNPDAEASWAERRRLFDLPRSTWDDYDKDLISEGGGVYPRTAKSIPITPQVREALGLAESVRTLTPTELIHAALQAPVDLLWNGGIGTYVKGTDETHAQVGDKANDAVRVDGAQVRARVAGEGGNLGWTQRGRIEYAQRGGRINTDFIDNSAGVDTSDHEVNIKVLLAPDVASGELAQGDRVELLASMTDEVAALVLAHNVDQNRALSVELAHDPALTPAYENWMRVLEDAGLLHRDLEALPSREEMERRTAAGETLTRPELASLLAWTKIHLERLVLASDLPDDPYLADRLVTYFPKPLRTDAYAHARAAHPLRREIVTMVTVNRFVDSQGITAFHRLAAETSSDVTEVVRAQLAARTILQVARHELALPGLDLGAAVELRIRVALQQMVERTTRWLLHQRRSPLDITAEAAAFTEPVARVLGLFDDLATGAQRQQAEAQRQELLAAGVPEDMARVVARAPWAHMALSVVDLAHRQDRPLEVVMGVHARLSEELGLDRVFERVNGLPRTSRWDTMARAALRDDLQALHAALAAAALEAAPGDDDAETVVGAWARRVGGVARQRRELDDVTAEEPNLAHMSVALRSIRTLLV